MSIYLTFIHPMTDVKLLPGKFDFDNVSLSTDMVTVCDSFS